MNTKELFEKYAEEMANGVKKVKVINQQQFTRAISEIITTDDCSVQATIESQARAVGKLKPCPFCGADVEYTKRHYNIMSPPDWIIKCKCGVSTTNWEDGHKWVPGKGNINTEKEAKEKLRKIWNTRA